MSSPLVLSLAAPLGTAAQPAAGTWKIGFLSLVSEQLEPYKPWLAAFRAGLRELGYVEGQNVVIEERYAAGRVERLAARTRPEQSRPASRSYSWVSQTRWAPDWWRASLVRVAM